MLKAAGEISAKARRAGKFAGTLGTTADAGRHFRDMGFRFIALGSDFGYLGAGANSIVEEARR